MRPSANAYKFETGHRPTTERKSRAEEACNVLRLVIKTRICILRERTNFCSWFLTATGKMPLVRRSSEYIYQQIKCTVKTLSHVMRSEVVGAWTSVKIKITSMNSRFCDNYAIACALQIQVRSPRC